MRLTGVGVGSPGAGGGGAGTRPTWPAGNGVLGGTELSATCDGVDGGFIALGPGVLMLAPLMWLCPDGVADLEGLDRFLLISISSRRNLSGETLKVTTRVCTSSVLSRVRPLPKPRFVRVSW
jgi:hypothetical protein